MSAIRNIQTDVLIVGGGIAGLWLLDELVRRGRQPLLVEANALGHGQTIASQGIIHGGLKYTLTGLFNASANLIAEMPIIWRDCLAGRSQPDLSTAKVRSDHCHLWRTSDITSLIGSIGARHGLRVKPVKLDRADWPPPLANCPGSVFRLDEQVIDTDSVLAAFRTKHLPRLLHVPSDQQRWSLESGKPVLRVELGGDARTIAADTVVLSAGEGNAALRASLGLTTDVMQRRPLHMVMLRGDLPVLHGHCTDGSATRVTITTVRHSRGQNIWQVGGQIAESDGVQRDRNEQIAFAQKELAAVLPGISLAGAQWSTYRVDRAECASPDGRRPDDVHCLAEGRVITAWPTKLAMAPRMAERVAELLPAAQRSTIDLDTLSDWPRPLVAAPPWETEQEWIAAD